LTDSSSPLEAMIATSPAIAPLALIVQSPAALKDAFAVFPQDLRATVRIRDVRRMRHHLSDSGIRVPNRVRLKHALDAPAPGLSLARGNRTRSAEKCQPPVDLA
jgi:hypothetical protein